MSSILDKIVEKTTEDLKKRKRKVSFSDLRSFEFYEDQRRNFAKALKRQHDVRIIAEIKKASPSKGTIRPDFDVQRLAAEYREGGAAAISVLTDEPFFEGKLENLSIARREVELPLLRKDFIVDPYQIEEARAYGADAVLLIATITEGNQLGELHHAAEEAGLECLVECYHEEEVEGMDWEMVKILGVNNRDLHTFNVDVHRGVELLEQAPDEVVTVSESGLRNVDDLAYLYDHGINAALIGEHFMRQPNTGEALAEMIDKLKNRITSKN